MNSESVKHTLLSGPGPRAEPQLHRPFPECGLWPVTSALYCYCKHNSHHPPGTVGQNGGAAGARWVPRLQDTSHARGTFCTGDVSEARGMCLLATPVTACIISVSLQLNNTHTFYWENALFCRFNCYSQLLSPCTFFYNWCYFPLILL